MRPRTAGPRAHEAAEGPPSSRLRSGIRRRRLAWMNPRRGRGDASRRSPRRPRVSHQPRPGPQAPGPPLGPRPRPGPPRKKTARSSPMTRKRKSSVPRKPKNPKPKPPGASRSRSRSRRRATVRDDVAAFGDGRRDGGAETGLVGGDGDEAAADRQDGDEQDGGDGAVHDRDSFENWDPGRIRCLSSLDRVCGGAYGAAMAALPGVRHLVEVEPFADRRGRSSSMRLPLDDLLMYSMSSSVRRMWSWAAAFSGSSRSQSKNSASTRACAASSLKASSRSMNPYAGGVLASGRACCPSGRSPP